jgi:Protein of unknown function (DUF2845)
MNTSNVTCAITWIVLLAGGSARAESMRCGPSVVDETTSVTDLIAKCGEPASRETKSEDVLARNPDTGFTRKIGTQIIERWIYQHSSGALPMAITIVDGKVVRLERAE